MKNNNATTAIKAVLGCSLAEYCNRFYAAKSQWVTGSLSGSDARFLFKTTLEARAKIVIEIGTASGFSTALLCEALKVAHDAKLIASDFQVISYDITSTFYADESKRVGDAAREQLSADLVKHIVFRNPADAMTLKTHHFHKKIEFLFIDANHQHPWPTVDLLAALPCLRTGATVLLHDINLPSVCPEYSQWGAKHLFDDLRVEKWADEDAQIPNIGAITIPADKKKLRKQLIEIFFAHSAEMEVPADYLQRVDPTLVGTVVKR